MRAKQSLTCNDKSRAVSVKVQIVHGVSRTGMLLADGVDRAYKLVGS